MKRRGCKSYGKKRSGAGLFTRCAMYAATRTVYDSVREYNRVHNPHISAAEDAHLAYLGHMAATQLLNF